MLPSSELGFDKNSSSILPLGLLFVKSPSNVMPFIVPGCANNVVPARVVSMAVPPVISKSAPFRTVILLTVPRWPRFNVSPLFKVRPFIWSGGALNVDIGVCSHCADRELIMPPISRNRYGDYVMIKHDRRI